MECTEGFYDELVRIENGVSEYDLNDLYWYQDRVSKIKNVIAYLYYKVENGDELNDLCDVYEKSYEVRKKINRQIFHLERSK